MLARILEVIGLAALLAQAGASGAQAQAGFDTRQLAAVAETARALPRLNTLVVARDGEVALAEVFRGPGLDTPVNVKSVSKSVIAALVGIAIDRGVLEGPDQTIGNLLPDRIPPDAESGVADITVGNLLSLQAGLDRTSGRNYGRWVQSDDWVAHVLSRPFVDRPGGRMLYSTGSTHLLSAILTRASGRTTLDLAREWLGGPLGIAIPAWDRDPQGIYMGGNNMALSPRALLRFGEMYRRGGAVEGQQVLSREWVENSWLPRTRSPFSGDAYGYGWFLRDIGGGRMAAYARGFGGQFLIVVPSLAMTVVVTSSDDTRLRVDGYGDSLWSLVEDGLVPAALAADGAG